jgi:hypothetical protein
MTLMRSNPIQAAQQTIETPVQALPVPLAPASVSPCEGFFCRAEERLPGAHRIIAVFRLDGFIDERICSAAIDHLQRRHPKLRAAIVRDPDGRLRYHFDREAPPIRRDFKDYDGTECSWREEARRLVRIPIPLTGPFIAFSVFRNRDLDKSVLIVCTHHGIADGISSMMLVDDLLTEYARIEAQSSAPTRPALEFVSVAHAAETPGWRKRWWLLRRFVRLRLEERRARQTALPESPKLQPIPQWEHWCFSAEETSTLVQRCRQEKASLAGVLVSAAYCSLMKCLPDSEALFRSQIPFSVRGTAESPAGKISPYDVGAFVGQMIEFHRVTKQTDFWELARSARESVKGFVDNGGPSLAYNLIALSEKQMLSQAGHKMRPSGEKRPTLLVTNYGTVRMGETYGSLRAREGITTFNNFPQGATLAIAALTMGGRLNVGLAAGTLEPTFWYLLRKEVRGHLDATMKPAGQG